MDRCEKADGANCMHASEIAAELIPQTFWIAIFTTYVGTCLCVSVSSVHSGVHQNSMLVKLQHVILVSFL